MAAAEMDAILAELDAASLVEQSVDADDEVTMHFPPKGAQLARSTPLSRDDDAAAVLDALLDEVEG